MIIEINPNHANSVVDFFACVKALNDAQMTPLSTGLPQSLF